MRQPHDLSAFWSLADQSAGAGACWPWQGTLKAVSGYGTFSVNRRQRGAHRVAWELTHGEMLATKQYVCHRCDNPRCVNPAHLFIGSARDNARDMIAKGRDAGPLNENARKTVCPRGHAYDAIGRRGDGGTFRVCSRCQRERSAAWKQRLREQAR